MPIKVRWEQCCEAHDCKAPARHHGLCAAHYLGLTPFERKVLKDCAGQPTEEIDSQQISATAARLDKAARDLEVDILLRALAELATFDEDRHFKDAA